jgi:hypothetical protein
MAAIGAAGTVVSLAVIPGLPARPNLSLGVVTPRDSPVVSPIIVAVCGQRADGSSVRVPASDQVLSVSIDGRQEAEQRTSAFAVPAAPGAHELRVELLASGNRPYAPPLATTVRVEVTGPGILSPAPRCAG